MNTFSWFSLIFSGTVAASTVVYVLETRRLRLVQTEPSVIAYLAVSSRSPHKVFVVIKNIGAGQAKNLSFCAQRLPVHLLDEEEKSLTDVFLSGVLREGLDALAPGQEVRVPWRDHWDLRDAFLGKTIDLVIKCKNGNRSASYETRSQLSVDLLGVSWNRDNLTAIAHELTHLRHAVSGLAGDVRAMHMRQVSPKINTKNNSKDNS